MIKIFTALVLIAAAMTEILIKLGAFELPEYWQYYPNLAVLFVGVIIFLSGLISVARYQASRRSQKFDTTEQDKQTMMQQVLVQQSQNNKATKSTLDTGAVIYDDDAI